MKAPPGDRPVMTLRTDHRLMSDVPHPRMLRELCAPLDLASGFFEPVVQQPPGLALRVDQGPGVGCTGSLAIVEFRLERGLVWLR